MLEKVTQAEFARLMGVARSTVCRTWKQSGRLVMDGEMVLVEASRERLAQTSGGRDDVMARHALERGQEIPTPTPEEKRALESRAAAQARKESAQADLAELEFRQKNGELVERAEVEALFAEITLLFRQLVENQAHRLAPSLVQKDLDFIRGALKQDAQQIVGDLWKEADKRVRELSANE